MRSLATLGGGAALLTMAGLGAVSAGFPAFAAIPDKMKSFMCSSSSACVNAANAGSGNGISATSAALNAVQGITASAVASGVYGEADNPAGGVGVAGRTVNGTNDNSQAVLADGGNHGGLPLLIVQGAGTLAHTIVARNLNTGVNTLVLDNQGNMKISGLLQQGGTFSSTTHRPTIEDTGEARLHDGAATVALDRAFASTIDRRSTYVVLLTPEADTPGLYVAARSPRGFTVRETRQGHSSIPFAYRIVAQRSSTWPDGS